MKNLIKYGFIAVVSCFLLSCDKHQVAEGNSKFIIYKKTDIEEDNTQGKYKYSVTDETDMGWEFISFRDFNIGDELIIDTANCN